MGNKQCGSVSEGLGINLGRRYREDIKHRKMDAKESSHLEFIIHATIVNASDISSGMTIVIDTMKGKIIKICKDSEITISENNKIIDATGRIVIPGGIDPHVHMQYPQGPERVYSSDTFRTGSEAALLGGTTTIIDFVEPVKGTDETMIDALKKRKEEAERESLVDYTFHMTIHTVPCDLKPVCDSGIYSYKIYTAYGIRLEGEELYQALKAVDEIGGIAIVHCEDNSVISERLGKFISEYDKGNFEAGSSIHYPEVRPDFNELNATRDVISKMKKAHEENKTSHQLRLHIAHISVPEQVKMLGDGVSGEICPHHFVLDDSVFKTKEAQYYQCAPPIRNVEYVKELRKILSNPEEPNLLFCVTDHCPFTKGQRDGKERKPGVPDTWWKDNTKPMPFWVRPGGLAGIQERLQLLYEVVVGDYVKPSELTTKENIENNNNKINIQLRRFVSLSSTNAAERYNLKNKGKILEGYDADIVIFRPECSPVNVKGGASISGMNLYSKEFTHMTVDDVFMRGIHLVKSGKLTESAKTPKGRFVHQSK